MFNGQLVTMMEAPLQPTYTTSINFRPCDLPILHGTRWTPQLSDTAGLKQVFCPQWILQLWPNLQFQYHHCFMPPLTVRIPLQWSRMSSVVLLITWKQLVSFNTRTGWTSKP